MKTTEKIIPTAANCGNPQCTCSACDCGANCPATNCTCGCACCR